MIVTGFLCLVSPLLSQEQISFPVGNNTSQGDK